MPQAAGPWRVRDGRRSDLSQAPEVAPYFDVHRERIRAHQKHGAQGNSREDAHWTNVEWLPILMEELGEAAHELTYDARLAEVSVPDGEDRQLRKAALRAELVQVAAMACAWIAAIDRG